MNYARPGVNVKLIQPHIPDKKLVCEMARCHCQRVLEAGVEIYKYELGVVHARVFAPMM